MNLYDYNKLKEMIEIKRSQFQAIPNKKYIVKQIYEISNFCPFQLVVIHEHNHTM